MAAPSLKIPLSVNMDEFTKNIESAKSATSSATQFIIKKFIDMNATLIASTGAAGGVVLAFRSLLGIAGQIVLAYEAVKGLFDLMAYATNLAKERIEEFSDTAQKAAAANVSTDFFQRMSKSADTLRLSVDSVTEALTTFAQASKDKLGGSDLQQEIDKLVSFGNLGGNAGVGGFAGATDTESKLRAIVALIDQAMDSGQRLAALDLADKAFGPTITDNLRKDSGYLDEMLAAADAVSKTDIVSQEQIATAIDLKTRLEDAQKILSEKFKPIQDDLAQLGVNYHESWIEIVEAMASAVTYANSLYGALKQIPDVMAAAGSSPFWTKLTELSGRLGLNSDPASLGLEPPGTAAGSQAQARLGTLLKDPNQIKSAQQQAQAIQSLLRPDTSKSAAPDTDKDTSRDQFEIAIDAITKHIATINADTAAVMQNKAAQQQFRTEFQLLTAIMRDGGEVTQAQIDAFEKYRQSMSATEALQAAGITLTKEHADAFLSASTRIKDATASYDLAAEKLKLINSASSQLGSALSTAFSDAVVDGQNLNNVLDNLAKTLEKAAINQMFSVLFNQGAAGGLSPAAQFMKGLGIPGFADGTDSAPGGLSMVGENGPELLNIPKGAQVIPNDVLRQRSGGDLTVNLVEDSSRAGQVEKNDNGNGFDLNAFVDAITAKNTLSPGSATAFALNNRNRLAKR